MEERAAMWMVHDKKVRVAEPRLTRPGLVSVSRRPTLITPFNQWIALSARNLHVQAGFRPVRHGGGSGVYSVLFAWANDLNETAPSLFRAFKVSGHGDCHVKHSQHNPFHFHFHFHLLAFAFRFG